MKKLFRKILLNDLPVSEYSTVEVGGDIHERVYLASGNVRTDISTTHWLLCLDPVIFGIWFVSDGRQIPSDHEPSFRMFFMDSEKHPSPVAVLKLSYFNKMEEPDGTILLLKLDSSRIRHVHPLRARLIYYRYYKKPEQDFLRLKSFAAAYSYPRRVRLISFREGDWYNIFPMDLVGDIPGSRRWVFGLRHSNVSLPRIIETGKMAVSEVPSEYKNVIYELGKHHRKPLSAGIPAFELVESGLFGFPIPVWADGYKEIRIIKTMNLGSHMLLWGEEANEKLLHATHPHLFHIHFLHYMHQKNKGQDYPLV
jgi:hypothetical protein